MCNSAPYCGRYYCSAGGEHRVRDAVSHGRRKKSEEERLVVDIPNSGGCGVTNSASCHTPHSALMVLARRCRVASALSVRLSVLSLTLTAGFTFQVVQYTSTYSIPV